MAEVAILSSHGIPSSKEAAKWCHVGLCHGPATRNFIVGAE